MLSKPLRIVRKSVATPVEKRTADDYIRGLFELSEGCERSMPKRKRRVFFIREYRKKKQVETDLRRSSSYVS